jgi:hypothetical protein
MMCGVPGSHGAVAPQSSAPLESLPLVLVGDPDGSSTGPSVWLLASSVVSDFAGPAA